MSVLGDLENRLNIKPVDFSTISRIEFGKGVDFSTPTPKKVEQPRYVVPSISQKTFQKLDSLWECNNGTAQDLYNKLCGDLPKVNEYNASIIQKILAGMQCGNITRTKINDLLRELCGG